MIPLVLFFILCFAFGIEHSSSEKGQFKEILIYVVMVSHCQITRKCLAEELKPVIEWRRVVSICHCYEIIWKNCAHNGTGLIQGKIRVSNNFPRIGALL